MTDGREIMPTIEAHAVVPCDREVAFAVAQTHGRLRMRWDSFIRAEHLLDGAEAQARGVQTWTRHRWGMTMITECVSFQSPSHTGMRMLKGPWFLATFAGGWRFKPNDDDHTLVSWKYNFTCRPRFAAPLMEMIGKRVLRREIRRRIDGFVRGCQDDVILQELGLPASRRQP